MQVNIPALREALRTTSAEISAIKKLLRTSGQPEVTAMTYWNLGKLKERATLLCALRAHARGRLHQPAKMSLEAQGSFVAKIAEQYAPPPAEARAA